MVLENLKLHTIVSGSPVRLKKLMSDCPSLVKDVDAFLREGDPHSPRIKLKMYLQDAVEERMALFIGDRLKKFPTEWHKRIVCGIFVGQGDMDVLHGYLRDLFDSMSMGNMMTTGTMETRIPLRLMTEWGLSQQQCCRLIHRYNAVQHILNSTTVHETGNKKVTLELKPTVFQKEENLESLD